MDHFEYLKFFIDLFEEVFIKFWSKKKIDNYKTEKNKLLKEIETHTEKIIDDIEKEIKDFEQRFKDYKAAGVSTDNIIKKLDELETEKNKQKKKLNDIKRLKD